MKRILQALLAILVVTTASTAVFAENPRTTAFKKQIKIIDDFKSSQKNAPSKPIELVEFKALNVTQGKNKPAFIVSPNGNSMSTSKDVNLVDSNKKDGKWLQIHNTHTDAKVAGSPHTHFPKTHDRSTTREIKPTDGADLDKADEALKSGAMRYRTNRKDRGG